MTLIDAVCSDEIVPDDGRTRNLSGAVVFTCVWGIFELSFFQSVNSAIKSVHNNLNKVCDDDDERPGIIALRHAAIVSGAFFCVVKFLDTREHSRNANNKRNLLFEFNIFSSHCCTHLLGRMWFWH